jgi:hypothetical protein
VIYIRQKPVENGGNNSNCAAMLISVLPYPVSGAAALELWNYKMRRDPRSPVLAAHCDCGLDRAPEELEMEFGHLEALPLAPRLSELIQDRELENI